MPHVIETAPSGRARCRGCRQSIGKGELRFGAETVNQWSADGGPSYLWYHLACAAKARPFELGETLATFEGAVPDREALDRLVAESRRTARPTALPHAERAPSGRSKCVACEELIDKGALRVAIERELDTGTFATRSAGYLHPGCVRGVDPRPELLAEIRRNSPQLEADELAELERALSGA